jgi:hypothetical protein
MSNNFQTTRGQANSNKIVYAKLVNGVPFQFRVYGNVLRQYSYWLKSPSGKANSFENLGFDRELEKFVAGAPDPVKELGLTELDANRKVVPIKSKRSYKLQVLNRSTNQMEILDLKTSIFNGMISYMQDTGIEDVTSVEWVVMKSGTTWNDTTYTLDILKTQRANKDTAAVATQHEADQEILAKAKPISELFPRETYEQQKKRLQTFLSAAPEAPAGEGDESLSDLDD